MNAFFKKYSSLILSAVLITAVFALNIFAQRSIAETMASLRQVPITKVQTDRNIVALTFNLTEHDNSNLILKKLGSRKATFFISRRFLYNNPEKVNEIINAGHSIGLLENQLKNTERAVIFDLLAERIEETSAITGINCNLIRVEHNRYDGESINALYSIGLYPVQWSADCNTDTFKSGDIILVENGYNLDRTLANIEKSGCTVTPAEELLLKDSYSVDINGTMLPD